MLLSFNFMKNVVPYNFSVSIFLHIILLRFMQIVMSLSHFNFIIALWNKILFLYIEDNIEITEK